ncbi:MAG: Tetratricopeptide 2 repeat protein [Bryobacterales bacterium]|nr:Tetratricopeptide 2 repeat protein [Bryobacterales bacterium]
MMGRWILGGGTAVAIVLTLSGFQTAAPIVNEDALAQARNLGKAFYENPTTQAQSVDQFKKALDMLPNSARERVNYGISLLRNAKTKEGIEELLQAQKQDPKIPHTWFNLAIAYKKESEFEKAIEQFQGMVKLVPDDPISHYNLGVLYKLTGKPEESVKEVEISTKLNPNLAGPHFQLYNAYRQAGKTAEAAREQATFQGIKKRQVGAAVAEDLEWNFYAEIYDPVTPEKAPASTNLALKTRKLEVEGAVGATAADLDGDGKLDLIVWSSRGAQGFVAGAKVSDIGMGDVGDILSVSVADFNNDGLADLAVLTKADASLWLNVKGKFTKSELKLPKGAFSKALWVDYDHDYDLDLVLLGAQPALVRNNGAAGFSNETAAFPFVKGTAIDGVFFDLVPDTDGMDLVVSYADRGGVLYRDKLNGKYEAVEVPSLPAGAKWLSACDLDNDSATDLVFGTGAKAQILFNRAAKLEAGPPWDAGGPVAVADLRNSGLQDVIVAGTIERKDAEGKVTLVPTGAVYLNDGQGHFAAMKLAALDTGTALTAATLADGRTSVVAIAKDGASILDADGFGGGWLRVALAGVKNLKQSYGAKVEVKSGAHYQKKTYLGMPLDFGLRDYKQADTVRITWANGLIQNEVHQAAGKAYAYKEAQRLSGSCPMIFTWNGTGFTFLTDVLGVAPLGASSGDGKYFPTDHDEYVQIPGEAMVQKDGAYEIRITEELREVSYLDQIQLIAVDHPKSATIYTNDKFKSPPFPDFRLYGVEKPIHPTAAADDQGRDVLAQLLKKDARYPDAFERNSDGTAPLHHLDLNFGTAAPANKAVLVLSGWVDWADGSTFLGKSQETKEGLIMPYLQVKNAQGQWQTVIADMGIPAGKPKTISVELTGKFLSASREVRIVTNLCVYWDEIFLSEDTSAPQTVLTKVDAKSAGLGFRGFSKAVIDPARKQPEYFVYDQVSPVSNWNPTPGSYTRYGDVRELLGATDDRFVIMGSGDELVLRFDPAKMPALRAGWTRDYLLMVDGWAKDADANTAFSTSVKPLPFHGMKSYPYTGNEHYPGDAAHTRYVEKFNTRPALRLLRPLQENKGI